jgi:hypothetical protein
VLAATTIVVKSPSDIASIVLGSLGVGLALVSIGWQAWTFLRSGSKVEVVIAEGRRGFMQGQLGVATFSPNTAPWERDYIEQQGLGEPVVAVTAHNLGRGETSISKCDVAVSDGGAYSNTANEPPLPYRLAGESEQTWYFPLEPIRAYVHIRREQGAGPDITIRGRVRLGSKKVINSKNSLPM